MPEWNDFFREHNQTEFAPILEECADKKTRKNKTTTTTTERSSKAMTKFEMDRCRSYPPFIFLAVPCNAASGAGAVECYFLSWKMQTEHSGTRPEERRRLLLFWRAHQNHQQQITRQQKKKKKKKNFYDSVINRFQKDAKGRKMERKIMENGKVITPFSFFFLFFFSLSKVFVAKHGIGIHQKKNIFLIRKITISDERKQKSSSKVEDIVIYTTAPAAANFLPKWG